MNKRLFDIIRSNVRGKYRITSTQRNGKNEGYHKNDNAIDFLPLSDFYSNWKRLDIIHKGGLGISPKFKKHLHIDVGGKRRFAEITESEKGITKIFKL